MKYVPDDAEKVVIEPYKPDSQQCCCGEAECADFEDRMKFQGIPLDEITTVTYTKRLKS